MRHIRKAAVLGSGIMGTGIACHLANVGVQVLLLDILPRDLDKDKETDKKARNAVADANLAKAIKSKPAPLYLKSYASRIETGNFEDDFHKIKDCDWIIEVVIERLDIKKTVFEKVEQHRREDAIISSNTSGIPIHMMAEGRSEGFQKHFLGTHFFNPPRYLRLLEIIPTPHTDSSIVDFMMDYGSIYLGKQTVLANDTPAFIANRVGVYAMAKIFQLTEELELRIEEVDKLTGPALGRPNTGTFRLGDLVGHDTAAKVIQGIKENRPDDEQASTFVIPSYLQFLLDNEYYGDKSGQGFYRKTGERDENGKSIIHALNLKSLEYEPRQSVSLDSLKASKQIDKLENRVKHFMEADDKGGELVRRSLLGLFAYSSNRIPEITDNIYSIDQALRAGFGWNVGPFEYWDMIGLEKGIELAEKQGEKIADWVKEMKASGAERFYKSQNGQRLCYDIQSKSYVSIPGNDRVITLDNYREQKPVYENPEVLLHDIGDQVLCLEFRSKQNAIGEGILNGINDAVRIAEDGDWAGLVIGNNAQNFTVGANLMLIAMMAYQQDYDELNLAVNLFQKTTMRCRYSAIPVVAATQGYVFGGGCEVIMHCDAAMTAAESYIGLVEAGVGLIPGGAGTKEFAVRASDEYDDEVRIPVLIDKFKAIAMAQVATSAYEAHDLGYLNAKDEVIVNATHNIHAAKQKVLALADNYTQPIERSDVLVLGREGLASLYLAANELRLGQYASEHDILIAKKMAFVLCGGDLTGAQQVTERYLLDLEREAFLSLCGEQKTLARIQHMLEKGKPLRN